MKQKLIDAGVDPYKVTLVHDGVPLLEPTRGGGGIFPASDDPQKGAVLARQAASIAGIELKASYDLRADVAGAGYLLYLTESEGLGSGALLAMAAGVPVIASNVGGLREVVKHGKTGFLVRNEPEEVAAAIGRLAGDDSLREAMGAAARIRVERHFSLERMVARTVAVYREVFG